MTILRRWATVAAFATVALACSSTGSPDASSTSSAIVRGQAVGPVRLGMTYEDVTRALGPGTPIAFARIGVVRWDSLGLEIVVTMPEAETVTPSARVIAIGVRGLQGYTGSPRPGQRREEVERELGPTEDRAGPYFYWASGVSVELGEDDVVRAVSVFAPYASRITPPPMEEDRP